MKSIAIWYENFEGKTTEQKISLHFNLWKLPNSKNRFDRFLDTGLFLENASDIKEIKIFFPCCLKNEIEDLGKIISNDRKLVSAVFNEDLSIKAESNSNYVEVSGKNIAPFFIYTLGQCNSSIFEIENNKGSIITIKNLKTGGRNRVYLRFRIKEKVVSDFFQVEELANAFIQNAFSKVETIDFRLNEIREIDPKILEEYIQTNCFFKILKAHFFYMCSSKEENIFSNKELNNCRHLEQERWGNYINANSGKHSIVLAYHWKFKPSEKEDLTDFSLLIKSKFESISWRSFFKYLLWLVVITVSINMLSNCLYSYTQQYNQGKTTKSNTTTTQKNNNQNKLR